MPYCEHPKCWEEGKPCFHNYIATDIPAAFFCDVHAPEHGYCSSCGCSAEMMDCELNEEGHCEDCAEEYERYITGRDFDNRI